MGRGENMEYLISMFCNLATLIAIFAALRSPKINFSVVELQATIATDTLTYGLGDARTNYQQLVCTGFFKQ